MHKLPVIDESLLDRIGIARPCVAEWEGMKGGDRVRHCATCKQHVYNVSAMERVDAVRLIAEHEGRLCLRLLRRADGTLITRDCNELVQRARRRGRVAFAVAMVLAGLVHVGLRAWGIGALWSLFGDDSGPIMMGAPAIREPAPARLRPPGVRIGESDVLGAMGEPAVVEPALVRLPVP